MALGALMREWRAMLDAFQTRLAGMPTLLASPQPFAASALPETLMLPGDKQAFCVEIPTTQDNGQRQSGLAGDGHTVVVSVASRINVTGGWADSLGAVLDIEQRIRDVCINRREMAPYRVRWGQTTRTLTADRAHIVSRLAFTVDHESEVMSA